MQSFIAMLALTLALGLCTPGFIGLQRSLSVHGCGRGCRASGQTLRARLRPGAGIIGSEEDPGTVTNPDGELERGLNGN